MSHPSSSSSRAGITLLDLVAVLALLGVALGLAIPASRAAVDRRAVSSVRDQALAALHRSRLEARMRGGAVLEFDGVQGRLRVLSGDSLLWSSDAPGEHRVTMALQDGGRSTAVRFDALGLGILASRTVLFRGGGAEAGLVISSRGRGRRRWDGDSLSWRWSWPSSSLR